MMSKFTTTPKKPSKPLSVAWKPLAHQKKAVTFLLKQNAAGLFLDPGLGKTSIVLKAIQMVKKAGMPARTLIIAPLRVCYMVWPKEQQKWSDFHDLKIVLLHGKDKQRNLETEADIYVINPEGLPWLMQDNRFRTLDADILVVDESSKFKRTSTQRFKLIRPVLPRFARRWILTGSPAPNGLMDLFGQVYILDLGRSLGQFITHFRRCYFVPTGYGGFDWKLQAGAQRRIEAQIKPLVLRMEAEDYIALPAEIVDDIFIELPGGARETYQQMEKDFITAIKTGKVMASNAAVASGKCCQIANGGIYDEMGNATDLHEAKVDAVEEIVEELQGVPCLVGYEFGHDLKRLLKRFGPKTPYLGGGVSPKRALEIEAEWNAGNIPVLFGQPASMGHGLNFQESGNHIIWHSLPWNFELYDQFIRRIRRQGSKHAKVFNHRLIAADTIDEAKIISLGSKHGTQKSLMDALKGYVKKKSL